MSRTEPYRYVLVGCGGQKRDCRNTLAYNLYTSAWFRWNRDWRQPRKKMTQDDTNETEPTSGFDPLSTTDEQR